VGSFIVWIIVGGIAGFLASKVLSGRGMGLPMDILIGIVGGLIGGYLAGLVGIAFGGFVGDVIVAFVGAVILLLVLRLLFKGGRVGHA